MIWTTVAMAGDRHYQRQAMDWRPIGEFHKEEGGMGKTSAREMCEEAARQLGLKPENYRCVRSK